MKNIILSLAVLCSGAAMAQATPVQVTQECIKQMAAGICMAIPDRASLAPTATRIFSGVGRVSAFDYQDYMDRYHPDDPTNPEMCYLGLQYMTEEPEGTHAKIARALWTPKQGEENQSDPITIAAAAIAAAMLGIGAATLMAIRKQEKAGA